MSRLILCVVLTCVASTSLAHFPDRQNKPVRPHIDGLIGPLGNRLPPAHRRKYNRPSNIGGWLAYWAAPSSQEAMAWHNATHRGNYKEKMPRTEMRYFYPKPWEMLSIGPRPQQPAADGTGAQPEPMRAPNYGDDLPASVIDVLKMNEAAQ